MMAPEKRKELIERRKVEFPKAWPGDPDFAPTNSGRCYQCGYDFVEALGDRWPTAFITGCSRCNRSYCD